MHRATRLALNAVNRAFYAEATYEFGPVSYGLSTQIRRE